MKNAIKKAIEGGWRYKGSTPHLSTAKDLGLSYEDYLAKYEKEKLLLDPLFWQSLGKQQGWDKYHKLGCYSHSEGGLCDCHAIEEWLYHWHRFIDHIAEGGDVDEFFNNLLK